MLNVGGHWVAMQGHGHEGYHGVAIPIVSGSKNADIEFFNEAMDSFVKKKSAMVGFFSKCLSVLALESGSLGLVRRARLGH